MTGWWVLPAKIFGVLLLVFAVYLFVDIWLEWMAREWQTQKVFFYYDNNKGQIQALYPPKPWYVRRFERKQARRRP